MNRVTKQRQIAAWLVHLYTVFGGILGLFALFEAARGNFENTFLLLIASHWVDGTDGLLARAVKVWEVLPNFSGEMVDNLIDIFTYLWLPVFIIWKADALPSDYWLILPVIGAMYAYGQVNMKTEDNFFLGFPTLWDGISIYVVYLRPAEWVAVLMILIPTIFSFIPVRFLYPSRNTFLSKSSWALAVMWIGLWIYILTTEPENRTLVFLSLYFPAFYLFGSFYANYRLYKEARIAAA